MAHLEEVRKRCLHGTYPFALALHLLVEDPAWRDLRRETGMTEPARRLHEAAAASDQMDAQWKVLIVVQRLLGRLDTAAPPTCSGGSLLEKEMKREIERRKE